MSRKNLKKVYTDRRTYLKGIGTIGAVAGMAGCVGGGGGGKPDTLVLGTWGGTWQELMIEAAVKPFEEETGITIEYVLGSQDRFNKLVAQKDDPPVDLTQQDTGNLVKGANEGLWAELDTEMVPQMEKVPSNFKTDTWVTQIFAASDLLYNTRTYDSPPSSYDAYMEADPGRVAMALPSQRGPDYDLMAFSLSATDGESFKDTDAAWSMYEEILANQDPQFAGATEEYGKMFANDEIDIARMWSARAAQWNTEDKGVTHTIPDSGAMMTSFGNAIPKNAPENKKEWAGKFIDFTLRANAAKEVATTMYYTTPNRDVSYPSDIKDLLVTGDDLEKIKVPDFDWMAENRDSWVTKAEELISEYK